MTQYFSSFSTEQTSEIPDWLTNVCTQMHKPENFSEGLPAMTRISGKTYEHLSRSVKKYYGKTTTEYINNLRLNYATNLLLQTNLSITRIAMDCGFSSVNYFNTCYKNRFGVNPKSVRKNRSNKF